MLRLSARAHALAHAQRIVAALVAAHGDDIGAMARDRKLNALQHTAGVRAARRVRRHACACGHGLTAHLLSSLQQKLKALLASYHAYAGKGAAARHGFRAPKKHL